jgi:hypothetical protein
MFRSTTQAANVQNGEGKDTTKNRRENGALVFALANDEQAGNPKKAEHNFFFCDR